MGPDRFLLRRITFPATPLSDYSFLCASPFGVTQYRLDALRHSSRVNTSQSVIPHDRPPPFKLDRRFWVGVRVLFVPSPHGCRIRVALPSFRKRFSLSALFPSLSRRNAAARRCNEFPPGGTQN